MKKNIIVLLFAFFVANCHAQQYQSWGYALDLTGRLPISKSFKTDSGTEIKIKVKQFTSGEWNISILPQTSGRIRYIEYYADDSQTSDTYSSEGINSTRWPRPEYWFLDVWISEGKIEIIRMMQQSGIAEGAERINSWLYSVSTKPD